jgi:hypothetical protein
MPLCHSKVEQVSTEDLVELSEIEKHNLGQVYIYSYYIWQSVFIWLSRIQAWGGLSDNFPCHVWMLVVETSQFINQLRSLF